MTTNLKLIHTPTAQTQAQPLVSLKLPSLPVCAEFRQADCPLCDDSGKVFGQDESNGKFYSNVRDCVCWLEKKRSTRLAIIPPTHRSAVLETLRGDANRHPKQPEAIAKIKANPGGNFYLTGDFGTGKTMLMWAIYRAAVMRDAPRIVACKLSELIDDYKQEIRASKDGQAQFYPRLVAGDLQQSHTKFCIFLDDIDKDRPSEYVAEQLFKLSDAIYDYGHQIIVTTNLNLENLAKHFERADERYGGGIVRRLAEGSEVIEMF